MITALKSLATLLVLLVGVTGCSTDWRAEIDSNTHWYGEFGAVTGNEFVTSSVEGTGSRTIDLPDEDRVCCFFIQEGNGYVNVTIKDRASLFPKKKRTASTNVNGNSIQICTEGTYPAP